METLKYPYRPRVATMVLVLAFFSISAVVWYICILTHDRTLKRIRLDAGQATVAFWILTAVSTALALLGLVGVVRSMTSRQVLVIDAAAIRLPKSGFSGKVVTVAYDAIARTRMREISGQRLLIAEYIGGKVTIAESLLPDKAAFDAVANALAERIEQTKAIDSTRPGRRPGP